MDKSLKEKYLRNLAKRQKLEEEAKELAWQIMPAEIKDIVCGEDGIWEKTEKHKFLKWLIKPHVLLENKSPVEMVINGKSNILRRLLGNIKNGNPV